MNFQEIRQKYPDYVDMSDEEFAQKFHSKFYSDMPFEQFATKVGYSVKQQPTKQEGPGFFETLSKQAAGGVTAAADFIAAGASLPVSGLSMLGNLVMGKPLNQAVAEGQALAEYMTPTKVAEKLGAPAVLTQENPAYHQAMAPIEKLMEQTQKVGDYAYEQTGSPVVGAATKTLADLMAFGAAHKTAVGGTKAVSKVTEKFQKPTQPTTDPLAEMRAAKEAAATAEQPLPTIPKVDRGAEPISVEGKLPLPEITEPYVRTLPEEPIGETPLPFVPELFEPNLRLEGMEKRGKVPEATFKSEETPLPDLQTLERQSTERRAAEIDEAYRQREEQQQAEFDVASQRLAARKEPLTLEPEQRSVEIEKPGERTTYRPNKQNVLAGFRKKQAGAWTPFAGKESKPVTPEELQKQYRDRYGEEIDYNIAKAQADKLNAANSQIKSKVQAPKGMSILGKSIGVNDLGKKGPLTPQEVKEGIELGTLKDIDNTLFKKIINTPARLIASGTYGLRNFYNNPILEATLRPVGDAFERAERFGNQKIYGATGVANKLNILSPKEYEGLWTTLTRYEGTDTPFEQVTAGLTPNQVTAAKAIRELHDADLKAKNEWRERHGMKPITGRSNYLASTFFGDNIFFATDKNGKIVAAVPGYKSDLAAAQKYISENFPDVTITDTVSNIRTGKTFDTSTLAELIDSLNSGSDIQKALVDKLQAFRDQTSRNVKGVQQHEKYKSETAVLGAQGYKPWKDQLTNAKEGFKAQLDAVESSILRNEVDKAKQTLNEFKDANPNLNAVKLAENRINDALGYNNWLDGFEKRSAKALNDFGPAGELILKGVREGIGPSKVMMNVAAFSMDVAFSVMALAESGINVPTAIARQVGRESLGTKVKTGYGTIPAAWGAIKGTAASMMAATKASTGKDIFDPSSRFYHEYAMERNIGNPTIEHRVSVEPRTRISDVREFALGVANTTVALPEWVSRYSSFQTLAHTFEAMGHTKEEAARLAEDGVKTYFGDYSIAERPSMYQRLGTVGQLGAQWRTWLHKTITNYSAAMANKDLPTLATMLATSYMLFGVGSIPMFEEMDKLWRVIRTKAGEMGGVHPEMDKVANSLSPKEWLKHQYGYGPFNGLTDRAMQAMGVEGSTAGRTEFRALPKDLTEILPAISFGSRLLESGKIAGKEILKGSLDPGTMALPFEQVAPKMLARESEMRLRGQKDEESGKLFVYDPKNQFEPKMAMTKSEQLAYRLGMQPMSRFKENVDRTLMQNKQDELKQIRQSASDNLAEAINRGIYTKDSKTRERTEKAITQFLYANKSNQGIREEIRQVLMRTSAPETSLRKLELLKGTGNFEMKKFISEVVPEIQTHRAQQ